MELIDWAMIYTGAIIAVGAACVWWMRRPRYAGKHRK